jgi:putative oxidoreductase
MHILFTIARVLLVLIFVLSGGRKLLDISATAGQIASVVTIPDALSDVAAQLQDVTGMTAHQLLAILAGVVEVVAALLIVFNIGTRGAAAVLALFTLVATFYFHAFWNMSGDAMQANMIHALKNLSIIGGLLTFVVLGSWRPLRSNQI